MKRTLVIGDIHGADRALEQDLERAGLTADDRLIFLGDFVDGWSGAKAVIDRLIKLRDTNDCIFIRGNHDVWCEEWLFRDEKDQTWIKHGGNETILSYAGSSLEERDLHGKFFLEMKNYHIDENNNLFIHAGFSSMHGPEREAYASNYSWDRTLWEMALAFDPSIERDSYRYPKRLKLFREIFIGHTPTTNYDIETPIHAANLWNVDTGAAFTGKITAMDIETKEFWQSDGVQTLYPDEKGRN
jgi:serine/threonine protein phosphatase 1